MVTVSLTLGFLDWVSDRIWFIKGVLSGKICEAVNEAGQREKLSEDVVKIVTQNCPTWEKRIDWLWYHCDSGLLAGGERGGEERYLSGISRAVVPTRPGRFSWNGCGCVLWSPSCLSTLEWGPLPGTKDPAEDQHLPHCLCCFVLFLLPRATFFLFPKQSSLQNQVTHLYLILSNLHPKTAQPELEALRHSKQKA